VVWGTSDPRPFLNIGGGLGQLNLPVTPYPPVHVHGVCVKVPQFSFSRLSGYGALAAAPACAHADPPLRPRMPQRRPVLGVEMASTGEVACFGKDKYEAYIKALLSTAFKLPKKNILLAIGSFKEKQEITPAVRKLHSLGYKVRGRGAGMLACWHAGMLGLTCTPPPVQLFATPGTADYLTDQGIPVQFVEAFGDDSPNAPEGDLNKKEHDLLNVLSSRQIDLYINLPSMNSYRRPANYMSRGYRTRRYGG